MGRSKLNCSTSSTRGGKKTLLPFKDYINVADHHQPCLSSTEATKLKYTHAAYFLHIVRKLAFKYRVCFQQMEQQNQQIYQAQVFLYPTELSATMGMSCICTGMAITTATCGYYALEMWLMQLRNWVFNFYFILTNLNGFMWLVATILYGTALEAYQTTVQVF